MEQQKRRGLVVTTERPVLRTQTWRVFLLPLAFTVGLAGLTFVPPVRQTPRLLSASLTAAAVLLVWDAFLFFWAGRTGRTLTVELLFKKQHGVQACVQASVLVYWGWYWPQVYASATHSRPTALRLRVRHAARLVAAEYVQARVRSVSHCLQYQSFPLVQAGLVLSAIPDGGAGPGRQGSDPLEQGRQKIHVFNPSSFPLALFSLLLLAKGASDITWGQQIATTQFYPPHMYLFLFLIALPGQLLFGVTSMTMSAVVTT